MVDPGVGWWGVPLAMVGGRGARQHAVPVRQPRRVLTEKSGPHQSRPRRDPGHGRDEPATASPISPARPGSACCGAGVAGSLLGALHAGLCSLPRVNDVAVGIALMLFGIGLAFYLRQAAHPAAGAACCRRFRSAGGATSPQVRAALQINVLFILGRRARAGDPAGRLRNDALGPDRAHGRRERRRRARDGLFGRPRARSPPPSPAASSPASAARSCRFTTPEAGARGCRAARA